MSYHDNIQKMTLERTSFPLLNHIGMCKVTICPITAHEIKNRLVGAYSFSVYVVFPFEFPISSDAHSASTEARFVDLKP